MDEDLDVDVNQGPREQVEKNGFSMYTLSIFPNSDGCRDVFRPNSNGLSVSNFKMHSPLCYVVKSNLC